MKGRIVRLVLLIGMVCLVPMSAQARQKFWGYCITDNAGVDSNQRRHNKSCTVTIYNSGTTTLSTIYSDNGGTAKSNPFTAQASGYYFFYAEDGRYDVQLSGGTPAIGTAFSLGDIALQDGSGIGDVLVDGTVNTSFQNAINTWVTQNADGGRLLFPWNDILPTATKSTSTTVTVAAKDDNWIIEGSGMFSSQISLADSADTVLFTSGSDQDHQRVSIWRMSFFGNKANQTATNPCLQLGVGTSSWDTTTFGYNNVYQCKGKAIDLGSTNDVNNDHFFIRNVFTSSDGTALYINQNATDIKSIGNQMVQNKYGFYHDWSLPATQRLASFGDHIENNSTAGIRAPVGSSLQFFSPYLSLNDVNFGLQTNNNLIIGGRALGNSHINDMGQYNTVWEMGCDLTESFSAQAGGCPMRKRYPTKDLHLPESIVTDWDMENTGTGAWTAYGSATIAKTAWVSAIDGKRYLKITCDTATDCGVTQDVADGISAEALFTVRYASSDTSGSSVRIIIGSDNPTTFVDSGALATPADTTGATSNTYGEYKWRTTATRTDGANWRITLECQADSAADACYFTDVQLLPNKVANGSFERDADGTSPPTGWTESLGNIETDTAQKYTGSKSMLLQEVSNQILALQGLTLTHGRDYLFSAMMRRSATTENLLMGYGSVRVATVDTGLIALNTNRRCAIDHTYDAGEWQYVECIITDDDVLTDQISFGTIDANTLANGWVDDVAVVELYENPQTQRVHFNDVNIDNNFNAANTIEISAGASANQNRDIDFLGIDDAMDYRIRVEADGDFSLFDAAGINRFLAQVSTDDSIYRCGTASCDHKFQDSGGSNVAWFDVDGNFILWSNEANWVKFQHSIGQNTTLTIADPGQATAGLPTTLTGSASLDYDLSAAGITCQDLTITVTGAATSDEVAIGIPNALASTAGVLFSWWVSAGNTVTVRACDVTSGNPDPAAATVVATVIK